MNLSNLEESEVWQVYESYWDSYLKGDVSALASVLADDYTQIGSVESEVFDNKKDAVHFIETTIDQIAGKVDMRNRVKKIEPVDPFVLITEQTDLYILAEGEWVFYAKFRASSFLQKKEGQWKFVHQHSSMPDIRAEEGENIATEKISRENVELRDAIKRRTIELEQKNQELAIEAALERVRAVAMGMRKPDDLPGICEILYTELQQMGFSEIRNAMINIYDDEKRTFINYDYSDKIGQSINHLNYTIHPVIERQIKDIRSTSDAFSETVFSGKDLHDWKAFRKEIGEMDDPRINKLEALYYYFYSIGTGAIGISTFHAIAEEKKSVLKRFRNVFEFAYRRFADVSHAEAQAREAQVEAALERVRSKTMAMHNSQDVGDTVATMFDQLLKLGVTTNRCGILIFSDTTITEVWTAKSNPDGKAALIIGYLDVMIHPMLVGVRNAWKNKEHFFSYELAEENIIKYYTAINNFPGYPTRFNLENLPAHEIHSDFYFPEGAVFAFTSEPIPAENALIFKRFAGVFGQTYRRYLDLQKAEAQAREALIEAALERVRSRTMGMQKSEELKEVIQVVFEQFAHININIEHTGFVIDYKARDDYNIWIADPLGVPSEVTIPYFDSVYYNQFNEAKEKGLDFFATNLGFEEKNRFYQKLFEYIPGLPEQSKEFYFSCPGLAASTVLLDNVGLYIENFSGIPYTEEENNTLMRFGRVFEQAYIRFLDLQKAEAQAREAKIEAALERTRTQSMIMQHSSELDETLRVFHQQVLMLGIHSAFSFLWLPDEDKDQHKFWAAWAENNSTDFNSKAINYPLDRNEPATAQCLLDWKSNESVYSYHVPPSGVENYFAVWAELIAGAEQIKPENFTGGLYYVEAFMKYGCFGVMVSSELKEDEKKILARFAIEFERTYTRFLDLQKSEAQVREATIETSLERMRAKTMAMHSSEDVSSTTATMFTELEKLGVENLRGGIAIVSEDKTMEVWSVTNLTESKTVRGVGTFDMRAHTVWQNLFESWKNKEEFYVDYLSGIGNENYIKVLNKNPHYLSQPIGQLPDLYFQGYNFGEGYIWSNSLQQHNQENKQVMKKFAAVFSLTFRRYLDLKRAEAQAREATIETSLEKVRGKALAMQNSNDLTATAGVVFTELKRLGINSFRSGVGLIENKESRTAKMYSAISNDEGATLSLPGTINVHGHPVLSRIWDSMMDQSDYFPVLKGELLDSYYAQISYVFNAPLTRPNYPEEYGCFLTFPGGLFYVWSEKPYTELEIKILQRFKAIVDLTFRRYFELQQAEANALEAVRRASLDRVRAETASMRTTADLEKITPMIWNELSTLGVPFIRCGVFIMDESHELIHTFLSTPDGKAIASFHLPYKASADLWETVTHWRKKEMYRQHWDKAAFTGWTKNLVQQGFITSSDSYATEHRPANLYLHFLPFMQGMLYVGNDDALSENDLQLVQNLADAFSTAYARYEDFNKLEAAKDQVDKTLSDLKQTQAQLLQAEKMASLGELTAGIAHEIQNPLNFVNNFSEINTELSEEIVEAAKKGDLEVIIQLAGDIKSNQDKISEHGKRADAIVKGMLQHSRTSSGVKEPTEINKLADEYFRLSYHGLRANDKSFNATLKTAFDTNLGKVSVISQDIGRVLLNLINNAFYAVNEMQKSAPQGYEPTVWLQTKRTGDKVEISVRDNGNGIPEKIRKKIFQPFFTTKPTGQGTGLGLSLSYDIIKAHGGELKLETKEGEGAVFIIELPVK